MYHCKTGTLFLSCPCAGVECCLWEQDQLSWKPLMSTMRGVPGGIIKSQLWAFIMLVKKNAVDCSTPKPSPQFTSKEKFEPRLLLWLIKLEKTMMWMGREKLHQQFRSREAECVNGSVRDRQKNNSQRDRAATLEGDRQEAGSVVQPKNRAGAEPSAQAAARSVPQSQPFRAPGMCPLEVQAGQLSVENKLLPCFQACGNQTTTPNTHTHTRPIQNLTLHPTLSSLPPPLC